MGRGLLKKGLVFCIKYIDLWEVVAVEGVGLIKLRLNTIYDTFKHLRWVERFYENSFRKLIDWFLKTLPINSFYVFLVKMLNLKKARNIYTRMLEFTFPGADMINQNGGWKSGRTLQ